jgi:hypothetical protein
MQNNSYHYHRSLKNSAFIPVELIEVPTLIMITMWFNWFSECFREKSNQFHIKQGKRRHVTSWHFSLESFDILKRIWSRSTNEYIWCIDFNCCLDCFSFLNEAMIWNQSDYRSNFQNFHLIKVASCKQQRRRENFFESFRIICFDMGAGIIEKEWFKVVV